MSIIGCVLKTNKKTCFISSQENSLQKIKNTYTDRVFFLVTLLIPGIHNKQMVITQYKLYDDNHNTFAKWFKWRIWTGQVVYQICNSERESWIIWGGYIPETIEKTQIQILGSWTYSSVPPITHDLKPLQPASVLSLWFPHSTTLGIEHGVEINCIQKGGETALHVRRTWKDTPSDVQLGLCCDVSCF